MLVRVSYLPRPPDPDSPDADPAGDPLDAPALAAYILGVNAFHRGFGPGGAHRFVAPQHVGCFRDGWHDARAAWFAYVWQTNGVSEMTRREAAARPRKSRPRNSVPIPTYRRFR
jgi:hypothetical protein